MKRGAHVREPTDRKAFASVAHQLAAQTAVLITVRARMNSGLSGSECLQIIDHELAEVRAKLALNAAVTRALVTA